MSEVKLSDLKIIENPKGRLFHALKKSDESFKNFGEAYFSSVNYQEIKGWKKHLSMTLNLVVIAGVVRFVVYDNNKKTFQEFILSRNSKEQYKRLTIPSGFWMAFQGLTEGENLLLNIADIEHEPSESINKEIHEIKYEW
jgi:dTDP-4-dehydrorhamnose 3,5-epimerase